MTKIDDCKMYNLPKITDPRGNLTFIENNEHVPFEVRRVFYLYDIPTGEGRGAHAHKKLKRCCQTNENSHQIASAA